MKKNRLVQVLVILLIVAIACISFIGIYVKDKTQMINILPEYLSTMELSGLREVTLVVSDETNEVVYDSEGNVTQEGYDDEGNLKEGYTKQDEKVNKDEVLTEENYVKAKEVLQNRLNKMGAEDYRIKQNIETGAITIDLPEDINTDRIIGNLTYKGDFSVIDDETEEVLMDNNDVKETKVLYSNQSTGTAVYLSIEFNKEGKNKLEEITKKYIQTTDDEGNSTTKKISIKLDDEKLLTTYFGETITTGELQLSIGSASTNSEVVNSYIQQAEGVASLITNKKMDISYEIDANTYLSTPLSTSEVNVALEIVIIVLIGAFALLCIRHKLKGGFGCICFVGFIASMLLVLRFANVYLSFAGLIGLVVIFIVNYAFTNYLLDSIEKENELTISEKIKEAFMHFIWILLPLLIIGVVFTFIKWLPIASLGMVMFWGVIMIFIYNYLFTKTLLEN